MRSLAGPLSLLLVALAPIVVLGAGTSANQWGRWLVRAGGAVGIAGLVLTAAAVVNLFVPRTCTSTPIEERNRPVLSLVVDGGDCFRGALAQVGVAGLIGVAASAAVAMRSGRGDGGAAHAVPSR